MDVLLTITPISFQSIFGSMPNSTAPIGKPRPTDSSRVVAQLIRQPGCAVNVRKMAKNIRSLTTETIKG